LDTIATMINSYSTRKSAIADFRSARQRAKLQELFARITHEPIGLLGFEEIKQKLKANVSSKSVLIEVSLDAAVVVHRYYLGIENNIKYRTLMQ
jgi:hypothetical protein